MITCTVIEYIRPSGKKEEHQFELDSKYEQAYKDMLEAGYSFSAEMLDIMNNVCLTIQNSKRDADMKLCKELDIMDNFETMLEARKWENELED